MNTYFLAFLGLLSTFSLRCQAQIRNDPPKYVNLHLGMVAREDIRFKKSKKAKVVALSSLPQGTKTASYEGTTYYYNSGNFYTNYGGRYIQVAPTPGLHISSLPQGTKAFVFAKEGYYTFGGIFYKAAGTEYQVVDPQEGMIIEDLPSGSEKVEVSGADYYQSNGVLYHKVSGKDGKGWQIVGLMD
ncbi:hypothetical protein SAMN05216436_1236 [bacterium A37T11]|nr:hypothetical protein SAMN05216436_1236 [bacterium A37T11]